MIATGELVEKISAQLLPDDSVDLYVRATRPGSFEIIFEWINENRDVIIETLRLLFNLYKDWKVTPARGPSTAEKVGPNIHIHYHYHLLGEDDSDQYRIRPQPSS